MSKKLMIGLSIILLLLIGTASFAFAQISFGLSGGGNIPFSLYEEYSWQSISFEQE